MRHDSPPNTMDTTQNSNPEGVTELSVVPFVRCPGGFAGNIGMLGGGNIPMLRPQGTDVDFGGYLCRPSEGTGVAPLSSAWRLVSIAGFTFHGYNFLGLNFRFLTLVVASFASHGGKVREKSPRVQAA